MVRRTREVMAPFCWQPRVPVEMPKVWLPRVPLVVAASTFGTRPDWPAHRMVPTPQPTSWSAKETELMPASSATAMIFFIVQSSCCGVSLGADRLYAARRQGIDRV